jgi:hypothetical protein
MYPSREFLRQSREFNPAIRELCGGIRDLALSVDYLGIETLFAVISYQSGWF